MISIQSAMLVALGFLGASLLALLVAPAFWARAVRLTTNRIKNTMPLSDLEIRADKDRIRAEYAIKVHQLESQVEQVRMSAARQQIELNRRDARINEVDAELERLKATFEETQNARRVLEQTIADRLPRVEERLGEAKRLLFNRDREISELTRTSEKQAKALTEAAAINAQQQAELERVNTSLAVRASRNPGPADSRFEGEVALRADIEALRAKTRDQAQLLARLQSMTARPSARGTAEPAGGLRKVAADAMPPPYAAGADYDPAAVAEQLAESARQLRTLRSRNEDQSGEIARLKAALAVFENQVDADPKSSLRESRIALKARLQSLEAQNTQLTDTLQRLRSELASTNERAARQTAHFTGELKRLGAGTLPASSQARRPSDARPSLAERVAQARTNAATPGGAGEARSGRPSAAESGVQDGVTRPGEKGGIPAAVEAKPPPAPAAQAGHPPGPDAVEGPPPAELPSEGGTPARSDAPRAVRERRARLLDRISGIGRSS